MSALDLLREAQTMLAGASRAGNMLASAIAQLDADSRVCSKRIERQRRRLMQAHQVLACLAVALDEKADVEAGDVAKLVRDVLLESINGLDSVELERMEE